MSRVILSVPSIAQCCKQMLEVFGPDGLIAKAHPEYEYRPGQIDMAQAVMRAFEEKTHLIVEAGTGTGKTLAYLVPAVAAALGGNGRVIVSTGTKNLQEQLMEKDIPFLQSVLPKPFAASYMKGRSNYLCLNRLARAQSAPVLEGLDEVDYFDEVSEWSRETETGDRAELSNLPESFHSGVTSMRVLTRVSARSVLTLTPALSRACGPGLRKQISSSSIIICSSPT